MKVAVVGMGYIGLPTALMMAANGVEIIGVDVDKNKIHNLNIGELTFKEEGLAELYKQAVEKDIVFQSEYPIVDLYIVSVPTPYDEKTKKIDPSFVLKAVDSILDVCNKGAIICIESTISPGTIEEYIKPFILKKGFKPGVDIHIVHTPERIIPGNMLFELVNNSRTIGADEKEYAKIVKDVYSSFCKGEIVLTDIKTAEMTKVIENTFRCVNIAFANELALLCRSEGLDVYEVISICNKHPRVNILSPGPGVGGHCIPVDPWFLVGDYPKLAKLTKNALEINQYMPEYVINRILMMMKKNGIEEASRVGLSGLCFKENVDDYRESPTLQLLKKWEKYSDEKFKIYDPYIKIDLVKNQYHDFDQFIKDVDMVVIMVAHSQIKENAEKLVNKMVLDTRHCLSIDNIEYL